MSTYEKLKKELQLSPKTWVVTGVAGFIGSHLAEKLLLLNQKVIGVDNFSTGYRHNLEAIRKAVPSTQWKKFTFFEADICDFEICKKIIQNKDYVLHNAALDYATESYNKPLDYNKNNIDGFLNIIEASKLAGIKKLVYASSSAIYGDDKASMKLEYDINALTSPLALTKYVDELYAEIYAKCFNFHAIGLRYFNVFGPRQDPMLNHTSLIPAWFDSFYNHKDIFINGGGGIKRDFCYVDNIVEANILAALATTPYTYSIYNVGSGEATSLIDLFVMLKDAAMQNNARNIEMIEPKYRSLKHGDTAFSLADITRIKRILGYELVVDLKDGLNKTAKWFAEQRSLDFYGFKENSPFLTTQPKTENNLPSSSSFTR